jgi:ABC-type bacteriocin/lantibiotic exporter with double-glycine peptidase domain
LGLRSHIEAAEDIVRAAQAVCLKARFIPRASASRLRRAPTPAIIFRPQGGFSVLTGFDRTGAARLVDPVSQTVRQS